MLMQSEVDLDLGKASKGQSAGGTWSGQASQDDWLHKYSEKVSSLDSLLEQEGETQGNGEGRGQWERGNREERRRVRV